eukprot:4251831-Pyramimonas_sp.AAC.1
MATIGQGALKLQANETRTQSLEQMPRRNVATGGGGAEPDKKHAFDGPGWPHRVVRGALCRTASITQKPPPSLHRRGGEGHARLEMAPAKTGN